MPTEKLKKMKNNLKWISVVLVFCMACAIFAGPFLKIGVQYLLLKITAAVCGVFGCKRPVEMIRDFSGVMGALKKLSNSIQKVLDGDTEAGYEEMNATLDMFANSMNDILNEQTKFGGVANRLDMTTSTLEANTENLTSYLSQVKDIDYASAITQWMNAQYAYQASMQVASSSMGMSLLNYIQ